jgi:hypothetical protein
MNKESYEILLSILGYLEDGRVFMARERLLELLGINTNNVA